MHRRRGDGAGGAYWTALAAARGAAAMPLYVAIAHADRAWLACREGRAAAVEALAAPVVAGWTASPWQLAWLAAWPLLAAHLDSGSDALLAPVTAMLRPDQQRLGADIEGPFREAVELLAAGRSAAATKVLGPRG